MSTKLHWFDGPWPGRLALAARPRGGDWLEDEMATWHRDGVDTVVSLLEEEEERDLGLSSEGNAARTVGMQFFSIPIPDRQVPASKTAFATRLESLEQELAGGRNLVLHCRQGVGRTGLVAACLLLGHHFDVESALQTLGSARGIPLPETVEQRRWVEEFAETADLAG